MQCFGSLSACDCPVFEPWLWPTFVTCATVGAALGKWTGYCAKIGNVPDQPRMNKDRRFLDEKAARTFEGAVAPLNALVLAWRGEGRDVPWADPDLGGVHSRILFLLESPGPAASKGHGSGFISPDNNDPSAARFWRLSRHAGLDPGSYLNWNVVPWYVSPTGKADSASPADAEAALPYLHEFVSLLTELRVIVVMGGFAEHWWLRYLRRPDSPVLPLVCAPHPSSSTRRGRPGFEDDILTAMTKAHNKAAEDQPRYIKPVSPSAGA